MGEVAVPGYNHVVIAWKDWNVGNFWEMNMIRENWGD